MRLRCVEIKTTAEDGSDPRAERHWQIVCRWCSWAMGAGSA